MSDKVLVYGCGDLAWGERRSSPFGDDWVTGRLRDLISLQEGEALAVSLTDQLDGQAGWWPQRESPPIRVETRRDRSRRGGLPLLPPWKELVALRVASVTRQLQDPGVLVTPQVWSESPLGRTFLRAWSEANWRWAPLEEVLRLKFSQDARFVSAGSTWLRILEPAGSAVVANGAEAACALELVPRVLDNLLSGVSHALAAEWRTTEEPRSGWFTRQQIARRAAEALRDGRRSLELGTAEAPLFLFSSPEAAERFADLGSLRATLDLPQLSAAIWWEQIADPGFLQSPAGVSSRPAIRWEALETVLLGHPENGDESARKEIQSLHTFLRFNGRPLRLVDPATLKEGLEVGGDVEQRLARWEVEDFGQSTADDQLSEEEAAADGGSAAELPVAPDPLFAFRPDQVYLGEPQEPEGLKVWVDDTQVAPENVDAVEIAPGKIGYQLKGIVVPRGAIVRVDFEPFETMPETLDDASWAP